MASGGADLTLGDLERLNELLIGVIWLVQLVVYLRDRRRARFTAQARRVHELLLAGLTCWVLEPVANAWDRRAFFVLNAGVAGAFFFAGRALFLLEGRMHRLLRPESATERVRWRAVDTWLAGRAAPAVAIVLLALALAASWILLGRPNADPRLEVADVPAAIVSCAGLLALGLGFLREFTREKPELVSLSCGAAVVLYGCVQLGRVWQPTLPHVLLAAILLKITFLVAMASFWTLVLEMARAQQREVRRWEESVKDASRRTQAALELHDTVLNTLQGMRLWTAFARGKLASDAPSAEHALDKLDEGVRTCADSVRNILDGLPAGGLAHEDLRASLEDLLQAIRARSTLEAELEWQVGSPIRPEIADALAAIAFEACHNGEQHAAAKRIHVCCAARDGSLRLEVDDDGSGMRAPLEDGARGLANMRRRAETIGARFGIGARDGGGTRVWVEVQEWAS
jgi:signal transduction histidine kinase